MEDEDGRNIIMGNLSQHSKTARALKVYTMLKLYGMRVAKEKLRLRH